MKTPTNKGQARTKLSPRDILREALSEFSTPSRLLMLGLLCSSSGFRALPRVLAADSQGDRNGTFQILADGTQDLAALVGLFATDSVERYSVDYSRGYISVAMATCSLLGVLGYVRALVKLAMGSKACQDSAFPTGMYTSVTFLLSIPLSSSFLVFLFLTSSVFVFNLAPVRAILGVAQADRLPKEELVDISYISMTEGVSNVRFSMVKRQRHTLESFPISTHCFGYHDNSFRTGRSLCLDGDSTILHDWIKLSLIFGSLLLSASATSFVILLVRSSWSWSRVFASFGLFSALGSSSIMWAYVYIKEQTPSAIWGYLRPTSCPRWQTNLDKFALMRTAAGRDSPILCKLEGVSGLTEQACRLFSLLAGAVIAVG